MGDELVDAPKKTWKEQFEEAFPYYLMYGMTESQYWDGDCLLVKYYRKKDELEQDRLNEQLWMQGLYVYEAIIRLAPALVPFAKNPNIEKYLEKPFPRTSSAMENEKEQEAAEARRAQKSKLQSWAERVNSKMRKKDEQES